MPTYLSGRDEDIQSVSTMFDALIMDVPVQSVVFSGLRGVGKTVLINKLQKTAEDKGIFCRHIEVEERNDFISQIAACSQSFLRQLSSREKFKKLIQKSLEMIKSLVVSFDPTNNTFSLSMQEKDLYRSTNLTQSLIDVFTALGETASESKTPICFFIDEIQYMKQTELSALIAALHRVNQLGYPIMIIGAGLPKIYTMLSKAKSYSERLFLYKEVSSLTNEQARKAIEEPVKKFGALYTEAAVNEIIKITKGYPFFVQQFCRIVYDNAEEKTIDVNDVKNSINEFFTALDNGFFKVRYERCTERDKKFIFAMASCEELPCTISNIAKNLGKSANSISPARAQLINKGIIYPARYGELDFTVPEFDGFIKRLDEYNMWVNSNKSKTK